MFWADEVAQKLKERNLPLEWVDDMKTPSGRVHVGSLIGVVVHDLVYKCLTDAGVHAKYTYVFENHDPMDDIPSYLPREKYEKYLGMPLFMIPSPVGGYKDYATYFAQEFIETFNAIGSHPEILWTKDLYTSGKMNAGIKTILDNAQKVRDIYAELYKKEIANDWYPFQVYCEQCGKVSTTRVYDWDGELVSYTCPVDATDWTKGCGYKGKTSPFSDENGMKGKMPWKVEWPVKWQAIGVTVEGAGKDHMSKGGSHDLATLVCERILHYPVPYPIPYEFLLIGGKKMSSSKGRGMAASEMLKILPPELVRFLIVRMDINKQTNFDPYGDTIPHLFDEYQKAADAYFNKTDPDLARIFELSQIGEIKNPPVIRFSTLAQWIQMPNMTDAIKREGLEEWAKYARIWVDEYAPESERYNIAETLPEAANSLSDNQKQFLNRIASELETAWDAEEFQKQIFEWAKEIGLSSKEAFAAIYLSLIGKPSGPKAGWLILSLDKSFVQERFRFARTQSQEKEREPVTQFANDKIFSIDTKVKEMYPSISVGVAVIKGVSITAQSDDLESEKKAVLGSLDTLTTEAITAFPEVQSYRQLYKAMGVDWHSRRPSPEALLRRIAQKKGLYTVNTCVDAYNLVVLKNRISIGAFDFDKIDFPTILRFPKAGEEILLLGDTEPTQYKETELAYFDQKSGYNIDFNYRDSQRTAVFEETKNVYVNVDGIFSISPQEVERTLQEACDTIQKYCGGEVIEFGVLTAK